MNIDKLSSGALKKAISLLEKKEFHAAKITEIERQLASLFGDDGKPAIKTEKVARAGKHRKRGEVKEAIVKLLKGVGPKGITRKEICQRLSMSSTHLNAWLNATGNKIKEIKRVDRGTYAWQG
jgi:hypothetical protein